MRRAKHPPIFMDVLNSTIGTAMTFPIHVYGPDSAPMHLARRLAAEENPTTPRTPTLGEALHRVEYFYGLSTARPRGVMDVGEHDPNL